MTEEIEISEKDFLTAYRLWLEAGKPPYDWFMRQPQELQSTMASLGNERAADFAIAIAMALRDPEAASAGMDADTNPESEEILARKMALQAVQERHQAPNGMGGFGQRSADQVQKPPARTLFGKAADTPEVTP